MTEDLNNDFQQEIDFETEVFDIATINPNASFKVANSVIEGQFRVTNAQWRIFWTMISLLNDEDDGKKYYQVAVKDVVELSGLDGKDLYNRIKKEVTGLMGKVLVFRRPNGNLEFFNLVARATYLNDEKIILVKPSIELLPFFQNLKNNYTLPRLKALLQFRVVKFGHIYLMLKQWENSKTRAFTKTLSELRFILELPESYDYTEIKRRFLIPAERALNKTDMAFTYRPIKKAVGKGFESVQFKLNDTFQIIPANQAKQAKELERAKQLLADVELTEFQIKKILDLVNFGDIAKTVRAIKIARANKKINSTVGAYAFGVFAKKFGVK